MKQAGLSVRWIGSIKEVDADAWNTLARPLPTPLLEHEWLALLEASGSVTPDTGWRPQIPLVFRNGTLVAACPLYIRDDSEGEFVFDYMWAQAAHLVGIPYYPKLVGMSPLTPVAAFQFLIDEGEQRATLVRLLLEEIKKFIAARSLSGVHFQYVDAGIVDECERFGFHVWKHPCYLWENEGYRSFDDFLMRFTKNQRRNIRREHKSLVDHGISIKVFSNDQIPASWYRLMYDFYAATNDKFGPWGAKYLTIDFFRGLFQSFRHQLVIIAGFSRVKPDVPVGMALLLQKGERLLGRYWGSRGYIPELHFNVCYYAPIKWAIEQGIRYFDPGIGTEHKARRGFKSIEGYSLHSFADWRLDQIFMDNIKRLNGLTKKTIENLNNAMPLKAK